MDVAGHLNRRVPRHEEGGASAPPDVHSSYEYYLTNYVPRLLPDGSHTVPLPLHLWQNTYIDRQCVAASASDASLDASSVLIDSTAPLTAADFCAEAARLVGGPRAATHGDKTINFQNIAELWNGYWRIKCRVNGEPLVTPFTAHDVGCFMELFKIARRFSGSFNADDYIDAAGYAGCTGEIAARNVAPTS